MRLIQNTNHYYTARQLRLPLEIEKIIDISDPVYTFCEVMDHIDLSGYFVKKGYKTGRPGCGYAAGAERDTAYDCRYDDGAVCVYPGRRAYRG